MPHSPIDLRYTTIKTPVPDTIYDGLREFSRNANTYHPQPAVLIDKIAKKHRVSADMIFLTAGADEALRILARTRGRRTYVFTPTYIVYRDVEDFGGTLTPVDAITDNHYRIEPKTYTDASLILLANPNNPAGETPKDEVLRLIAANRTATVCIDEAYGGFAPDLSVVDHIGKHSNLIVLRSFSKDYGMAGNRIGYMIAQPHIIDSMHDKTQWSNVSYLSVGAAVTALDHEEYFAAIRDDIHALRGRFETTLTKHGFLIVPSRINAVLIKFGSGKEARAFVDYLGARGIRVNHGSGNANIGMDESFVRIAIGTPDQMAVVSDTIIAYSP